jgi:UrcA family protein
LRLNHRHEGNDMNTRFRTLGSTTVLLAALLSSAAFVERAQADATPATLSAVVQYTPDDLAGQENRRALEARIASAARAVCGSIDIREIERRQAVKACRKAAVANALAQVEAERSAALRD